MRINQRIEKGLPILFIFFTGFCLLPMFVCAQPQINSILSGYSIEEFPLPGGQKSNRINCITQGPYGFLWFGSHEGLHRYDGYEIVTYKETEGGSTSVFFDPIVHLLWDSFDKLWISTYGGGLFCFDPETEQFKHFKHDPRNLSSLRSDNMTCAIEDASGNLWFGTEAGLNRFDRKTEKFERYIKLPGRDGQLAADGINNLYVDSKGVLWVATGPFLQAPEQGGLCKYIPETNSFECFVNDPNDESSIWASGCRALLEDKQGNFWVGTAKGLQKMDREKGTFEKMYPNSNQPFAPGTGEQEKVNATSLLEDQKGGIWVGASIAPGYPYHLLRYDPFAKKSYVFPSAFDCWELFESHDGTIWVGEKLMRISPKPDQPDFQAPDPFLEAFKKTPFGNNASEAFFSPYDFTFDKRKGTLWSTCLYAPLGGHHFFLGSFNKENGQTKLFHLEGIVVNAHQPPDVKNFGSYGMGIDSKGKIWGSFPGVSAGLFSFDPETGTAQQFPHIPKDENSLSSNFVTCVLVDNRDGVWATTYDKGLNHFNTVEGTITRFDETKTGGQFPNALLEDPNGIIWVGGGRGGPKTRKGPKMPFLASIDISKPGFTNYTFPEEAPKGEIRFLIASPEGHILFTLSENGFGAWIPDERSFRFYNTKEDNFPFDQIGSLVFDKEGILWASSNEDNRYVRFEYPDGNQYVLKGASNQTAQIGEGLLGPSGKLHFMNDRRWSEIDPVLVAAQQQGDSVFVRLVNLSVQGEIQKPGKSEFLSRPIWLTETLKFPHTAESFSFRFSDFNFSGNFKTGASDSHEFYYRLYPYQENWQKTAGIPIANYYKVPPGTYHFQVKPYRKTGNVDHKMVQVKVSVFPPWWKTWWAYTLYLFIFLGIVYFIYRFNLKRQLEQQEARQLKELDELKTRFFTNITHEFRTPLTVIMGVSDELEINSEHLNISNAEKDNIKQGHSLIQRNSKNLLRLVNQLLDLSKLDSGAMHLNLVQADIIRFLSYLIESFHSMAAEKNIKLTFISEVEELVMDLDETKIQHIVYNLLSNAVKFTPKGGKIDFWVNKILEGNNAYVQIKVLDNGIGISNEQLPFIFDRFYQTDSSVTRKGEGTGIGLALAKELIELMGGDIQAKSRQGEGTVFTVNLPARREAEARIVEKAANKLATDLIPEEITEQVPGPVFLKSNDGQALPVLLIIEDNADVVSYMKAILQKEYKIEVAIDGRAGIDQAIRTIPDIIISDVMMPEKDGYEVCETLKADERTSHIPIILLTAKAAESDKIAGLRTGADAYLMKPFNKEELLIRLNNLLKIRKALQQKYASSLLPTTGQKALEAVADREELFLQKLQEAVLEALDNPDLGTEQLCRAANLSPSQLYRKMKALIDMPPNAFIRKIRLHKALELLKTTDLNISEIAYEAGFNDPNYFSRAFHKEFGKSPVIYRK